MTTTSKPARTPGPWKIVSSRANTAMGAPVENEIHGDGYVVARLGRFYTDTQEANAAFIVRSCNAHDDLVAALRLAMPIVGGACSDPSISEQTRTARSSAYTKLAAALSRATEGE